MHVRKFFVKSAFTIINTFSWRNDSFYSFYSIFSLVLAVTIWRLITLLNQPLELFFDEAQYWIWAQAPAWGYFSKPPIIAWIISLTTKICGDSEPCIRSGAPLAYMVGTLALYDVGRRLYSSVIGFWAAAIFLTLPGVAFSAIVISVDPFLLMFWAIALAVLVRALVEEHLAWWVVLGGVMGLGFLSKYAMLFFILSLLCYLIFAPIRRRLLQTVGPWLSVILAFICLAPNLLWNATHDFVTLRHTTENAHLAIASFLHPDKALAFISAQFAVFGPIPMIMLIRLATRFYFVIHLDKNASLNFAFTLPILVSMIIEAFLSRAHANWAAPAFVSATVLVVAWFLCQKRIWLLRVTLVLHLAIATVLYNIALVKTSFKEAEQYDPWKRGRGWAAISHMLMNIRAQHPDTALLFDTRKVLAPVVYYARPIAFDIAIWNPPALATNHFALIYKLYQHDYRNFLLVTEHQTARHIAHSFLQTELIAVLHAPLSANVVREVRVFRCEAFQGYG